VQFSGGDYSRDRCAIGGEFKKKEDRCGGLDSLDFSSQLRNEILVRQEKRRRQWVGLETERSTNSQEGMLLVPDGGRGLMREKGGILLTRP